MGAQAGSSIQMQLKNVASFKVRLRGPAIAARLEGRAELFRERFDRDRPKDPETCVEHCLATMRPFFVKDNQAVFLYRFFQMLRCTRGQMDYRRWLIKYEIARSKAIEAWLATTTPRPAADHADVIAEVNRLRKAEQDCRRTEVRQTFSGPQAGLQATIDAVRVPDATDAMREAARETVWRRHRGARVGLFPRTGLHNQNVEILLDASTFNFANGQQELAKEKCRV